MSYVKRQLRFQAQVQICSLKTHNILCPWCLTIESMSIFISIASRSGEAEDFVILELLECHNSVCLWVTIVDSGVQKL